MKNYFLLLSLSYLVSACSIIPEEAYISRGSPESLLDVSSEVVNLDISSEQAIVELSAWINDDAPSRAELYCAVEMAHCTRAQNIMQLYGIDYEIIPSAEGSVALVYERVLARDCENRYIDNSINPYHLNHPTFGCSLAVNMVQQVTDKQQFVRPSLMDAPDAAKVVQVHNNYMKPAELEKLGSVAEGLTE